MKYLVYNILLFILGHVYAQESLPENSLTSKPEKSASKNKRYKNGIDQDIYIYIYRNDIK